MLVRPRLFLRPVDRHSMPKNTANTRVTTPRHAYRAGKSPSEIANLTTVSSDRQKDRQKLISLHTLLTNKKNPATRDAARLGDVLLPWFEKTIAKPAARLEGISELWQNHVPADIVRRSRLKGFHRGTLSVTLDSATVRAELEAQLRAGLLRTLQVGSKGTLFRVRTSVETQNSMR